MQDSKTFETCALAEQLEELKTEEIFDSPEEETKEDDRQKITQKKEKVAFSDTFKKKEIPFSDLKFVRIFDPIHIPTYLIEQIHKREYPIEKFYDFQRVSCLFYTDKGSSLNPSNLLYALVNDKIKQCKGVLWCTIDFLTNSLHINIVSIDREYWQKGEVLSLIIDKAKKIMNDLDLECIIWNTEHPKFIESRGFKKSKRVELIYRKEDL